MADFTDNFNRADGAVGSDWTTLTGMSALSIISNQVRSNSGASAGHVATATATFAADHEAECVVPTFGAHDRGGPCVRLSGDDGYVLQAWSTTLAKTYRLDGGALTVLDDVGVAFTAGDTLRIRAEGTTISVFVNDVELWSGTDATYATGQPGLHYVNNNEGASRLDDFYATDLGAAATPHGPFGLPFHGPFGGPI